MLPQTKLTVSKVIAIRKAFANLKRKFAREYGITIGAVEAIIKRRNWGHVLEEESAVL